jgi:hypothetical protein
VNANHCRPVGRFSQYLGGLVLLKYRQKNKADREGAKGDGEYGLYLMPRIPSFTPSSFIPKNTCKTPMMKTSLRRFKRSWCIYRSNHFDRSSEQSRLNLKAEKITNDDATYLFFARIFAHLARCAAAIFALPAADILPRLRVVGLAPA